MELVEYKAVALVHDLLDGDNVIWNVTFSADDQLLATTSADEVVRLWHVESGKPSADLTGHSGGATDAAFLSDGVSLVSVDRSGGVHLWDIEGNRRLAPSIQGHYGASWRLSLHPDGKTFASTGDDGAIRLWDVMSSVRACEISEQAFDKLRRRQYLGENQQLVGCKYSP